MNCIRRIRRSLAGLTLRAGALPAEGAAAPAVLGQLAAAATLLDQAPTGARLQPPGDQRRPAQPAGHPDHDRGHGAHLRAGGDRVPDAGRAAALAHTRQLCIHCQQRPAGFWVRRTGGTVVRRPWCLPCCQDLDRDRYDVIPFGG